MYKYLHMCSSRQGNGQIMFCIYCSIHGEYRNISTYAVLSKGMDKYVVYVLFYTWGIYKYFHMCSSWQGNGQIMFCMYCSIHGECTNISTCAVLGKGMDKYVLYVLFYTWGIYKYFHINALYQLPLADLMFCQDYPSRFS